MKASRLAVRGQVTIPAKVRRLLGLRQGELMRLPGTRDIEAFSGLAKAGKAASLGDMKKALHRRGGKA